MDCPKGTTLKIQVRKGNPEASRTPALVVGVGESQAFRGFLQRADTALGGILRDLRKRRVFTGKPDQVWVLPTYGRLPAQHLVLVGLGKIPVAQVERLRRGMGLAARRLREMGLEEATTSTAFFPVSSSLSRALMVQALAEGAFLGLYRFQGFLGKEEKDPRTLKRLQFLEASETVSDLQEAASRAQILCDGVYLARDLVNAPSNAVTPTFLAEVAQRLSREEGLSCTILGPQEIQGQGMGAFWGVARGSDHPAQFIVLEYWGGKKKADPPVVVVGKSITFDSGGISLKPSEGMDRMKYDMSGGAATLGLLQAVARSRLPLNLVGILPATENLPSGKATKPGDILKSLGGWTIEVVNTDAEGRLALADGLVYALRYRPAVVVDIATLTGACVVALGHHAIGMVGNRKEWKQRFRQAGEWTGERVWEMPLWEEYFEQIKSTVADLKNVGGREGGMITAAAFLSKFVEDRPWVHLDIAGAAWKEEDTHPYVPKGAVGVGVRLLFQVIQDWLENKGEC